MRTLTYPAALHLAAILPAVALGALILLRKKGTRVHRIIGRVWLAAMTIAMVVSFWIQRGGFSVLHLLAVVSLAFMVRGVIAIRRDDRRVHRRAMIGVFIGSLSAGVAAFLPSRYLHGLFFGY